MPKFLAVVCGLAIFACVHALINREINADSFLPIFGRRTATIMSWVPVVLFGLMAGYFSTSLVRILG